jgi:archaellum component FlaC
MQRFTEVQAPIPTPTPAEGRPTTFVYVGADGKSQAIPIPKTRDEVRAIQARRNQISDQLENVTTRRSELASELAGTGAEAARTGLEARIQLLDKRILQLETDLATTGQQLELASYVVVPKAPPQNPDSFEDGLLAGGFSVFGFMAIVLFVMRRRWKRRLSKKPTTKLGDDATQRLERLENGMDAIAIEIERVSEGQRFVTKLLSDAHSASAVEREKVRERLGS